MKDRAQWRSAVHSYICQLAQPTLSDVCRDVAQRPIVDKVYKGGGVCVRACVCRDVGCVCV